MVGKIWPGGLDLITLACLWYLKQCGCPCQGLSVECEQKKVEGRAVGETGIGQCGGQRIHRTVWEESTFRLLNITRFC